MKRAGPDPKRISTVESEEMAEETRMEKGRLDTKVPGRPKRSRKYAAALRLEAEATTKAKRAVVAGLLADAHALGDRRATYALGTWYFHGRFFPVDKKKGFALMLQAAEDFVADACFDVGVSYETGAGVRKDKEKAAIYYLRAMMLGERQSIEQVGRMFYWGIGVPKSRAVALEISNFVRMEG